MLLVSLKTSLVRRASSSMVRDSSARRLGDGFHVLARIDHSVDRRTRLGFGVFGGFGHRFGVIANGGDSFDQLRGDLFDRAFKFRGERSHLFAALERPLFFRLARGQLHRQDFERIVPKDRDCFDHPSDFVAPLAIAQLQSGGADRKFLHCMCNRGDRFDDRFGDTGSQRGKNTRTFGHRSNLIAAEGNFGRINIADAGDIARKRHCSFDEVHDEANLLQSLRILPLLRFAIGPHSPGERSIAGQRDHLRLVLDRSRVLLSQRMSMSRMAVAAATRCIELAPTLRSGLYPM